MSLFKLMENRELNLDSLSKITSNSVDVALLM